MSIPLRVADADDAYYIRLASHKAKSVAQRVEKTTENKKESDDR